MLSTRQLDNLSWIASRDLKGVRHSVERLGGQWYAAWREVSVIQLPTSNFQHLIVAGMGGSALGAHIADALYQNLPLPLRERACPALDAGVGVRGNRPSFTVVNDYTLPPFVSQDTLVVLSSYSGSTEETLACAREALRRGAKIVGFTTGGPLAAWLRKNKIPSWIFEPRENPAGAPRLAVGYAAGAMVALFDRLQMFPLSPRERVGVRGVFARAQNRFDIRNPFSKNPAKQLADKLKNRAVLVIGGGHLSGNIHVFQNQLHETAKTFATFFPLPELNHHLMEGLSFPESNPRALAAVLIDGGRAYLPRIRERLALTSDVLRRQKIPAHVVSLAETSPMAQAIECLVFSSWVAYYLGLLHGINPVTNEWVDYFKKKL